MRIVAGKHKGRLLAVPSGEETRPTLGRARQSLFDILEHGRFSETGESLLPGALVLEAFAGSGAFGFEALSRGAAQATLIDSSRAAQAAQRKNSEVLGESKSTNILGGDVLRPPRGEAQNLVFLDPPYRKNLGPPALTALAAAGWIGPDTLCIVEVAAKEDFVAPEGFTVLDERRYGPAKFVFLSSTRHGPA
jgi:16S rRNA (guanine966-N2)-methyltransferase